MSQVSLNDALAAAVQHYQAGRLAAAESICRQILAVAPQQVEAINLLAGIAHRSGYDEPAVELLRGAIALRPERGDLRGNLAEALRALGRYEDALAAARAALERGANQPSPYNTIGIVLAHRGQVGEATRHFRRALDFHPSFAEALNNLGNILQSQLLHDEAIAMHRRALEIAPAEHDFQRGLLSDLGYSESVSAEEVAEAHREWGRRNAAPIARLPRPPLANDRNPDRAIRVGLVSPDLRRHAVAAFLEPLLAARDRAALHVTAYAQVTQGDEVTERLRSLCDGWRSTVGVVDDAVVAQIREDRIDVLIDLAGHTNGTRILVLARKPALVQMSYLGWAFTTGMETIDYRITDAHADPPGLTEGHHVESLLRLPRTAWCYRPGDDAPPVAAPPMEKNGFVTFGSFNNVAKITPAAIATWAAVLRAVARSRLMLKYKGVDDPAVRGRLIERFAAQGVPDAAERVICRGHEATAQAHLAAYGEIDVALDTLHYCGTTTTCEALWMGVPVVTLAGRTHASRVGVSLLSNVGLSELIAADRDAYVSIAAELAGDGPRLKGLRSALRERMEQSPLRDEAAFARDFEAALRSVWRTWCESG